MAFNPESLETQLASAFDCDMTCQFENGRLEVKVYSKYSSHKTEITDGYDGSERAYKDNPKAIVESEKEHRERVELAKNIRDQESIGSWEQDSNTDYFVRFTSCDQEVILRLNRNDTWSLSSHYTSLSNIRRAKKLLVDELKDSDPVREFINSAVKDKLQELLRGANRVGEKFSKRLARKARFDGQVESLDDITLRNTSSVNYNAYRNAERRLDRFEDRDTDPIERVVLNKKEKLISKYGQAEVLAEDI